MDKSTLKSNERFNKIVYFTKITLLFICMLTAVPPINAAIRDLFKIASVWSFALIVYIVVKNKEYYFKKEYFSLVLFCCSYSITILLNKNNYLINEAALLLITVMLFFMITYCDKNLDVSYIKKELISYGWVIVLISLIYSACNIGILIYEAKGYYIYEVCQEFVGWNGDKLAGLYNPNTSGTICYISFIISIILFRYAKENMRKIVLVINMIFQFSVFMFSKSRGAMVCVAIYVAIGSIVFIVKKLQAISPTTKKNIKIAAFGSTAMLAIFIGFFFVKTKGAALNALSSGRIGIWKTALRIFKENNKLFGIGYRSIDDVFKLYVDESYYNVFSAGGTHNVYIAVLTAAGALGLILFATFLLFLLKRVYNLLVSNSVPKEVKLLAAFIPTWLVGEMFESRIVFGMNHLAVSFWIVVGYVIYFSEVYKNGEHNSSGL